MSKGLEALKDIITDLKYCTNDGKTLLPYEKRRCDIIERELKRLEELEKAFDSLLKDNEKTMKELTKEIEKNRALEIIKMYVEFVKLGDEYRLQLKNNLGAVIFHPVYAKNIDLLKEMLS